MSTVSLSVGLSTSPTLTSTSVTVTAYAEPQNVSVSTITASAEIVTTTAEPSNQCVGLANYWYVYLGSSAAMFACGLTLSLVLEFSIKKCSIRTHGAVGEAETFFVRLQHFSEELNSGKILLGKVLMTIYFVFSVASWLGYIIPIFASGPSTYILAQCGPTGGNDLALFDIVANSYFALILIIRYLASRNRIKFWFAASTLVDCATIPSSVVAVSTTASFYGMGFLRAIRFLNIPDILVYTNILHGYRSIRIVQITCNFVALWFTGAGLFALVQQFGDVWNWDPGNPAGAPSGSVGINYLDAAYFSMVTMATIGYGDVTPASVLGKVYACVFILTAVGMFASMIPEMFRLLSHKGPDRSYFHRHTGEKHVVLCGYLDYTSMKSFMRYFQSNTRMGSKTKLIFLGSESMDLKLNAMVKKHPTRCGFYQGSALVAADLQRARVDAAECVIMLCNVNTKKPDEEDTCTLMRLIAVKDFCPDVRCIIQLNQYQSKARLKAIPRWRRNVDSCICISELKLGLIAQNCVAPGFCALLTNLITFSSKESDITKLSRWKLDYLHGVQFELYYVRFSDSFSGLLFSEAVEICFVRLNTMLVAIDILDFRQQSMAICINPHDTVRINTTTMCAFVIAHTEEHAQRVAAYCLSCHRLGFEQKKCHCGTSAQAQRIHRSDAAVKVEAVEEPQVVSTNSNMNGVDRNESVDSSSQDSISLKQIMQKPSVTRHIFKRKEEEKENETATDDDKGRLRHKALVKSRSMDSLDKLGSDEQGHQFDVTGLFHWCPSRHLSKVTLTRELAQAKRFVNHIVVCLFAEKDSPVLGLCNFVMPLRLSSVAKEDLKDIVIICDPNFIDKEWNALQNFPSIFILPGSPLNRANLRAVNLPNCSASVILSAAKSLNFNNALETCLIDKEALLCTANIKAMPKNVRIERFSKDKGYSNTPPDVIGDHLHLFTELSNVQNGTFLGRSDTYRIKQDAFMLEGYACGRMFNVSVLNSLVTTTYFSRNTLTFIQTIITGGSSDELELLFAENNGLPPAGYEGHDATSSKKKKVKSVCHVRRMSVTNPPLSECCRRDDNVPVTFRQLFLNALRDYGIICIGLFRKVNLDDLHHDCKRFVITCPKHTFRIDDSDLVFVLQSEKWETPLREV